MDHLSIARHQFAELRRQSFKEPNNGYLTFMVKFASRKFYLLMEMKRLMEE